MVDGLGFEMSKPFILSSILPTKLNRFLSLTVVSTESLRPDKNLGDGAISHVVRVLPALIDKF